MFNLLEVINTCSSGDLLAFTQIAKKILNLIQIFGPLLLIISLIMTFIKLMGNPDDKKLKSKIKNSLIATVLLFFIPMLVNVTMGMVDNSYDLSACWNTPDKEFGNPTYSDPTGTNDDTGKKKFTQDPGGYEKGEKTPEPSSGNGNGNGSGNNNGDGSDGGNGNGNYGTSGPITGDMQVHFINPSSRVDAIYIKVGNQSVYLDGGFKSDGRREIKYMDRIGVTKIDYYIGTHSHKDHIEAAPAIISKYGIKNVFYGRETASGSGSTPATWYAINKYAQEQNISLNGVNAKTLTPGDKINVGGLQITCIGPMSVTNGLAIGDTKQNYNSLILRLDYGSTSFLLTGDNSSSSNWKATESAFPGKLNVTVLKNAHHNGMNNESSYKLASAEYVVFLTDSKNLPSSSCINRIKKFGAKYYYVVADGKNGNVVFVSDGSNIKVTENYNP